jgi:CBS domain-containing protein
MNIGDICRRQVVTAAPDAALVHAAQLMRAHHVGSVVVVDERRRPVGIVTDRDIVIEVVAAGVDAASVKVGEVMSTHPATALEDEDLSQALKAMRDHGIRRLPVVAPAGELVGIVALDDLLSSLATSLMDVVQAIGTQRVLESDRRRSG